MSAVDELMTLDQVAASCVGTAYGVPVIWLGEDADGAAAFTTDRRRALAAMCAVSRRDVGDTFRELYDPTSLRGRWVLAYGNCGCNHMDPNACRGDLNGPVTCCQVDPDDDLAEEILEHNCERYGLPPCIEDLYAFVTTTVPEGTPGALHVFEVGQ